MIRVLIVDDSQTSRMLLRHIISSTSDMTVIGELTDGAAAVDQVKKLRPDVILMDVVMPNMDGMEATSEIMATFPTPIVMVSATANGRETEMAFQAIKQGALTLLAKPDGPGTPEFEQQALKLQSTVRAMSAVKVIHHRPKAKTAASESHVGTLRDTLEASPEVIGIVASTGGPAALVEIFQALPADYPIPLVVVQHINADFQRSLVRWVDSVTPLPARLAEAGQAPQPGITFAPSGQHLVLTPNRQFAFQTKPVRTHMPSGDLLLSSLATSYGNEAAGVVLTGMGDDGAAGLLDLYRCGALTIAQNEKTSAVYGMPAEAKRLGAVRFELSVGTIAPMLRDIVEKEIP